MLHPCCHQSRGHHQGGLDYKLLHLDAAFIQATLILSPIHPSHPTLLQAHCLITIFHTSILSCSYISVHALQTHLHFQFLLLTFLSISPTSQCHQEPPVHDTFHSHVNIFNFMPFDPGLQTSNWINAILCLTLLCLRSLRIQGKIMQIPGLMPIKSIVPLEGSCPAGGSVNWCNHLRKLFDGI